MRAHDRAAPQRESMTTTQSDDDGGHCQLGRYDDTLALYANVRQIYRARVRRTKELNERVERLQPARDQSETKGEHRRQKHNERTRTKTKPSER